MEAAFRPFEHCNVPRKAEEIPDLIDKMDIVARAGVAQKTTRDISAFLFSLMGPSNFEEYRPYTEFTPSGDFCDPPALLGSYVFANMVAGKNSGDVYVPNELYVLHTQAYRNRLLDLEYAGKPIHPFGFELEARKIDPGLTDFRGKAFLEDTFAVTNFPDVLNYPGRAVPNVVKKPFVVDDISRFEGRKPNDNHLFYPLIKADLSIIPISQRDDLRIVAKFAPALSACRVAVIHSDMFQDLTLDLHRHLTRDFANSIASRR